MTLILRANLVIDGGPISAQNIHKYYHILTKLVMELYAVKLAASVV
jgi:hypothetical protein